MGVREASEPVQALGVFRQNGADSDGDVVSLEFRRRGGIAAPDGEFGYCEKGMCPRFAHGPRREGCLRGRGE